MTNDQSLPYRKIIMMSDDQLNRQQLSIKHRVTLCCGKAIDDPKAMSGISCVAALVNGHSAWKCTDHAKVAMVISDIP